MMCMCAGIVVAAVSKSPHVVVVVNDGVGEDVATSEIFSDWSSDAGDLRVSPSRAATLAAIRYGTGALASGVVTDVDWRSRAVTGDSCFSEVHQSGGVGSLSHWADDGVKEISFGETPVIALIQQGGGYDGAYLRECFKKAAESGAKEDARPVVVLYITMAEGVDAVKRGSEPDRYHYAARWQVFASHVDVSINGLRVDYHVNEVVSKIISGDWGVEAQEVIEISRPPYEVFHRANWLASKKYRDFRYHDSLVISDEFALVDGSELYAVNDHLEPDLSKRLDITLHEDLHAEMLVSHAKWWSRAEAALARDHAIIVKGETKLTAKDWRPSTIAHQGGKGHRQGLSQAARKISSKSIHQEHALLKILEGLNNAEYRETFPAYSGSWELMIPEAGRYKVTASLLPPSLNNKLAKLRKGAAFVMLGENKVQIRIQEGATGVSVMLDAEAGKTSIEAWFTGQLALDRELGACYITIERVGAKMYEPLLKN